MHQSSVSWDITPLYFFSWNFIYFQQKEPIKVQIWWNFTWAVKIFLKFCTLMGSFCKKSYKVSAKKVQRSYLSRHWSVMQSLKKNWLVVSNMIWRTWWIFTHPLKSPKVSLRWANFIQSIWGLSYKNTEELSFMTLNNDAKFEKTLTLRFQKWYEELGEFLLEHLKVWKIVQWSVLFVKSI